MWKKTRATELLGVRLPVIQGPFGGGLSSVRLTSAVSNRGGLGSFGAHHLAPQQIKEVVTELRMLTRKPFAMNLWVSDQDEGGRTLDRARFERALVALKPYYDELKVSLPSYPEQFGQSFAAQVETILETAPPVFSFVFGVPDARIISQCKKRGIITIGTATTPDEAEQIEAAGVDMVVATGSEAGGHRVSFLESAEDSLMGTFSVVQLVAARVRIPVIAAGGIVDGRGVVAALALGAEAAQIGTAFLACEESNAPEIHKEHLFSAAASKTRLTRAFTGRLARGIANRFVDEAETLRAEITPYPSWGWLLAPLRQASIAQKRTDLMALWAGQATPMIHYRSAETLIDAIDREGKEAVARLQALC